MPIYEFECETNGHVFDRLQKLSDPDPETCKVCGEGPVRRRVTAPSFRLAGSGWYETDFKSDKEKRRNIAGDAPSESKSSEASKDAGSSGAEKKADTKSDAKPAAAPKPSATGTDA